MHTDEVTLTQQQRVFQAIKTAKVYNVIVQAIICCNDPLHEKVFTNVEARIIYKHFLSS